MKKKFKLFMLLLFGVLVAGVMSCARRSTPDLDGAKDSTAVVEAQNPVFNSIAEVVIYRDLLNDTFYEDSVFRHMDEYTLKTIAHILIKRDGSASKKSIVEEFRRQYTKIYKYLDEPLPSDSTRDSVAYSYNN